MSEQEFVIALMAVIFGGVIGIVFVTQLFGIIKSFINKNKDGDAPVEINEQLIEDYLAFKKHTDQRIQKLEKKHGISSPPPSRAELNAPSDEDSIQDNRKYSSSDDNKLKNMLRK